MRPFTQQEMRFWKQKAEEAGETDLYSLIAKETGLSRQEVKQRAYLAAYSGGPVKFSKALGGK